MNLGFCLGRVRVNNHQYKNVKQEEPSTSARRSGLEPQGLTTMLLIQQSPNRTNCELGYPVSGAGETGTLSLKTCEVNHTSHGQAVTHKL